VLGQVKSSEHSNEIAALPRVREFYGAQSIGIVRTKRIIAEKESTQVRYYISSLSMDAENFAMMRRLALSLMKRDTTSKKSLKRCRKICGYDERYLERLLFNPDQFLEECPPA